LVAAAAAVALLALLSVPTPSTASVAAGRALKVDVLSTRADLVTDGEVLVAIRGTHSLRGLKVVAGGKRQTKNFKLVDGTPEGVVRGLGPGRGTIVATKGSKAARLRVTNHPSGGPIFAGPQLQPWRCQPEATDDKCSQAPTYQYVYKSTDGSPFQPYDPEDPPSDVAMTRTDQGVEVPFIVRIEKGYIDRDQYAIAALYRPGKPWSATKPQRQFNGKLLITHGASCGVDYQAGQAPSVTDGEGSITGGAAETALGRGFVTMSNALDNSGHNCNLALQAESLVMTKEHLIDSYGALRYTIGAGCSGGSLAVQWIANAYPGIYQGILPTCSFPDAWSTATQFLDYHLMLRYFNNPSQWGPGVSWTPKQMADAEGHVSIANAIVSDNAQWYVVVPDRPCAGVSPADVYDSTTNPGGVRCSIIDAAINLFGPRDETDWGQEETSVGRGFAGVPVDNVGVQYGLGALQKGQITPAQFVDLNEKVGGVERVNLTPTDERGAADRSALANAYRTGMINETNNLDTTPIIDCRGPDEGLFHDAYRAFATRARLDREHGGHGNQLIFEGPVDLNADPKCAANSLLAMDRWLRAIEKDRSKAPLAKKIVRNKPAGLTDRCYDGSGNLLASDLCGDDVVRVYGTPRTVAGDAITTDTNKCQLKPLDRDADYGSVPLSDPQWDALEALFPDGVCDFSKPGVDQQGAIPWLTYQKRNGDVVYGGKPMGPEPRSKSIGRGSS